MITTAALVLVLQWGLLIGFCVVGVAALVAARPRPGRGALVAVLFLAAPHAAYYALFLIWPDALGPIGTMYFSIILRYQVLFVVMLVLFLARRGKWKI